MTIIVKRKTAKGYGKPVTYTSNAATTRIATILALDDLEHKVADKIGWCLREATTTDYYTDVKFSPVITLYKPMEFRIQVIA